MVSIIVGILLALLSFFPAWLNVLILGLCLFIDALFVWRLIKG